MAEEKTTEKLRVEDSGESPSIFVDGFSSVIQSNGVVKIRFFEVIMAGLDGDNQRGIQRVNLHLAMSVQTLPGVIVGLKKTLEGLHKDQLIPTDVMEKVRADLK